MQSIVTIVFFGAVMRNPFQPRQRKKRLHAILANRFVALFGPPLAALAALVPLVSVLILAVAFQEGRRPAPS